MPSFPHYREQLNTSCTHKKGKNSIYKLHQSFYDLYDDVITDYHLQRRVCLWCVIAVSLLAEKFEPCH